VGSELLSSVEPIVLANDDITVRLIPFGARVIGIETRDRENKIANIALRYAELSDFLTDKASFGAIVGRFANRIAGGRFTIEGITYTAPRNDGVNTLHGGPSGFAQKVWSTSLIDNGVEFSLVSPDGDMGFPGALTARCIYTLNGSSLRIDLHAVTDADTVINLTNHTYFNLSGNPGTSIVGHQLEIPADSFVPVNDCQIPTGEIVTVVGTPMDFRIRRRIEEGIDTHENRQLEIAGGYDQTWVLRGPNGLLRGAAYVEEPVSGRSIHVATTQPGLHLYTGNSLNGDTVGPGGVRHNRRSGFCLETQHFADSPNQPSFPPTLPRPGQEFQETTIYTFGVRSG
jgi:aldose 1-epimerase